MNKLNLSILLLIFSSFLLQLNAQTPEIDSLENLLQKHTQEDTVRVKLLNKTSYIIYAINVEKTFEYAKEAGELADKLSFKKGKAESQRLIGIYYTVKSDFLKALEYYQIALKINKELGNKIEISKIYNNIGVVYWSQGDFSKALKYYQIALKINEKLGDKREISKCYNNIGLIYSDYGNYPKTLEYYQKALKIYEEIGDKRGVSQSYTNIGLVYKNQNDYTKAVEYYQKALKIDKKRNNNRGMSMNYNNIGIIYIYQGNYPKALEYHQKALIIKEKIGNKGGISSSYNNIGEIYMLQADYPKANEYFQKALKISIEIGRKQSEVISYIGLASLYLKQNKIKEAYYYSKKAYIIANEIGGAKLLKESSEILAKSSEALGLYKEAYGYHVVFKTMSDSIFNENNIKEITNLENRYAFNKEKEALAIEQAKKETIQIAEMKRQKQLRNAFIGGAIIFLILSIIILYNLIQKRKANQLLIGKNEEIQCQSEELQTANDKLQELDTFKEEMTGMIVHDLKNPLNSIINLAKDETVVQSGKQMLNMILNILDVHKYEESQLVVDKMDYSLLSLSQIAVNEVFFLAEQKSIKIENKITKEIGVKADKEITERIFVNILTNAIKYTPINGKIILSADLSGFKNLTGLVKVQIKDTGQSIPQDQIHKVFEKFGQISAKKSGKIRSTGLGLTFCKMAVEAHGGEIGLESELEKGAEFWFTLPVGKNLKQQEILEVKTQTKEELNLSELDKDILKPYISKLQNLMVYEISEVNEIIKKINIEDSNILKKWKKEIENAVFTMNEEKYKELVNIN